MDYTNRIPWIDWSKAILILLMCIGHSDSPETLKTCIYTFHMPAFFIISGFLYKAKSLLRKSIALWIPIFCFGLLNFIFEWVVDTKIDVDTTRCYNLFEFPMHFPGYWFLFTLWILYMLFGLVLRKGSIIKRTVLLGISSLLVVACVEILVGLKNFADNTFSMYFVNIITSLPFFAFGVFLKEIKFNPANMHWGGVLLLLPLSTLITCYQGRSDLGEITFNYSYFLFFANACITSFVFYKVCSLLPRNEFIEIMSEGTLVILGIHRIVIRVVTVIFVYFLRIPNLSWVASLCAIIVCGYMASILCKKHFPFLLGKTSTLQWIKDTKL